MHEWKMPLSHSTLAGQFCEAEGPSDLTPGVAESMKSLRYMRR